MNKGEEYYELTLSYMIEDYIDDSDYRGRKSECSPNSYKSTLLPYNKRRLFKNNNNHFRIRNNPK